MLNAAFVTDLRQCSQILNVPNEKNRSVVLFNGNSHLINIIHSAYHITFPLCCCFYANVLIFVPMPSPLSLMLCLPTHSLSVSLVVSSLPLFPCLT